VGLVLAAVTGVGLAATLAAGPALAQPARALISGAPPPAARIAPGAVVANGVVDLFYTAADGSVWMQNVTRGQGAPAPAGGRLVSAPAPMFPGGSVLVFGQGTDNRLWVNSCPLTGGSCGSWLSLGGVITSGPAAVFRGPGAADFSVYARGADGAVWARDHGGSGWGPWHSIGGQLLAGTGPAAAYSGGTYVLVTGLNRVMYIQKVGATGFVPAGGRTNASPALTSAYNRGPLFGFARGTDNAGYYHQFLSSTPGWHFMGGRLASAPAAAGTVQAAIQTTYTFALGTGNQVYKNTGSWVPSSAPGFTGWTKVTG
jgi:hypothetical protein